MGFVDKYHNKYQTGGLQHLLAHQVRSEVGPEVFSAYFKFTVVRNPWDKAVSGYVYMDEREDLRDYVGMKRGAEFNTYLDLIARKRHVQWEPQSNFVRDENNEPLLDFVGRFENYPAAVAEVLQRIGVGPQPLPHENRSERRPYQSYYDREAKERVASLYAADIRTFGYEYTECPAAAPPES